MIKIDNLSFYYQKKRPVFNEVSFEMQAGIYGLLGENGVGKTTLLHLISGLTFPKAGSSAVLGYNSYERNPAMLQELFFLPEEFQAPRASVMDMAKYNSSFYTNYSEEQLRSYLTDLEVEDDRKISEMSTGQKKKAFIAYALSLNTKVTLFDEPTNGLDIPSKTQFRKILSNVADNEKCIIISTHQVRDLANLIDPIIILDRNSVLLNSSVENITRKLVFKQSETCPENTLFCEQTLGGYYYVCQNMTGEESTVNIELLFNAVVKNKSLIKELFND